MGQREGEGETRNNPERQLLPEDDCTSLGNEVVASRYLHTAYTIVKGIVLIIPFFPRYLGCCMSEAAAPKFDRSYNNEKETDPILEGRTLLERRQVDEETLLSTAVCSVKGFVVCNKVYFRRTKTIG